MPSLEYRALLDQAWDLHVAKNAGYAGADNPDAFANFRMSEQFGVSAFEGCMVRISDKYSRITSLMRNADNERVGESIRDTLRDLSAYALIAVCLLDEQTALRAQDGDSPAAPAPEGGFVGYGGTGDRSTRSAAENAVYGTQGGNEEGYVTGVTVSDVEEWDEAGAVSLQEFIEAMLAMPAALEQTPPVFVVGFDPAAGQDETVIIVHEVVSEEWGDGWFNTDADLLGFLSRPVVGVVDNRGVWPPDTRVAGLLTCCGQSSHPIDCPQWR